MKSMNLMVALLVALMALACSDDDTKKDSGAVDKGPAKEVGTTDTGSGHDKAVATPDQAAGGASVKGEAGRTTGTCPKGYGSKGTLCLSLRTDCAKASTEVAKATVADADMNMPSPPQKMVPFEIKSVADGTYQLHAMLDGDASGCTDLTNKDLYLNAGCVKVEVKGGQEVTGVKILFDAIK